MKKQIFIFLVLLIVGMITSFANKGIVKETDEVNRSVVISDVNHCEAVNVFLEICDVDSGPVTGLVGSIDLKRDTDLIVSIFTVEQESRGSPTSTNVIPLATTLIEMQGLSSGGLSYIQYLT